MLRRALGYWPELRQCRRMSFAVCTLPAVCKALTRGVVRKTKKTSVPKTDQAIHSTRIHRPTLIAEPFLSPRRGVSRPFPYRSARRQMRLNADRASASSFRPLDHVARGVEDVAVDLQPGVLLRVPEAHFTGLTALPSSRCRGRPAGRRRRHRERE